MPRAGLIEPVMIVFNCDMEFVGTKFHTPSQNLYAQKHCQTLSSPP